MAIETMSYHLVSLGDGRKASGCMSIKADGRLEGVRLRFNDSEGTVREYLATAGGHSFRSILTGEKETKPEMLCILRETFDRWCRTFS